MFICVYLFIRRFRYTVGYLIWGYFIIYIFGVIVGVVILGLRMFVGEAIFGQFLLKLVPVICVVAVKTIFINKFLTSYVFLYRKSKILALNNFRAFNVFLYFNFYFDCFMGIISAVIRYGLIDYDLLNSKIIILFYFN